MYYFQTIITKKSKLLVIFIAMMLFSVLYASEEKLVVHSIDNSLKSHDIIEKS